MNVRSSLHIKPHNAISDQGTDLPGCWFTTHCTPKCRGATSADSKRHASQTDASGSSSKQAAVSENAQNPATSGSSLSTSESQKAPSADGSNAQLQPELGGVKPVRKWRKGAKGNLSLFLQVTPYPTSRTSKGLDQPSMPSGNEYLPLTLFVTSPVLCVGLSGGTVFLRVPPLVGMCRSDNEHADDTSSPAFLSPHLFACSSVHVQNTFGEYGIGSVPAGVLVWAG